MDPNSDDFAHFDESAMGADFDSFDPFAFSDKSAMGAGFEMPPVLNEDMMASMYGRTATPQMSIANIVTTSNPEQHVKPLTTNTKMAPERSSFTPDGSEYTFARFPGYDGADIDMAPASYDQNMGAATTHGYATNNTIAPAQYDEFNIEFDDRVLSPITSFNGGLETIAPLEDQYVDHQSNSMVPPQPQHFDNRLSITEPIRTPYVENQYATAVPPQASHLNNGLNIMASLRNPPVENQYNTTVPPQTRSIEYHPMVLSQPHFLGNQYTAVESAPYQDNVVANDYISSPSLQYGSHANNLLETSQRLVPTDNTIAPPRAHLITPPKSDSETSPERNATKRLTSQLPSYAGVKKSTRKPSAAHLAELETETPVTPYMPNAPKKKAGRPAGSKTRKPRYDSNYDQMFTFENITVSDFTSSGNALRQKPVDAVTGEVIPGGRSIMTGSSIDKKGSRPGHPSHSSVNLHREGTLLDFGHISTPRNPPQ